MEQSGSSASAADKRAAVKAALAAVNQQLKAERQRAKDSGRTRSAIQSWPSGRLAWRLVACLQIKDKGALQGALRAKAVLDLVGPLEDARKREAKWWRLTEWIRHVALIVFMLSGQQTEPAVQFLADTARKHRWPAKDDEELKAMVEDLFLGVDLDVLTGLCDLGAPSDPAAAAVAVRIAEEWRLIQWVQRLNQENGVAPTTNMVLARLEERRLQLPEAIRPAHRGTAADGHARAWARRWRLQWGARHGKVRAREDLPLEEMQAKAQRARLHRELE